jgi:hypothetical protein
MRFSFGYEFSSAEQRANGSRVARLHKRSSDALSPRKLALEGLEERQTPFVVSQNR